MEQNDRVAATYSDVVAHFADLQSAFTIFQQQPNAAISIKTLEDEKHHLLNALIELDRAIFDLHYSLLMKGGVLGESGTRQQD
jgi:hypothetical protein